MAPIIIKHRVNDIAALRDLEVAHGAEIDLRADPRVKGLLYTQHDAWTAGPSFEEWLAEARQRGIHGPLIINTKEDGLEDEIRDQLARAGFSEYFFLDTALPTLFRRVFKLRERNFALRYSKYESLADYEHFVGRVDWVWADCIDNEVPNFEMIKKLARHFRVCLVSPELIGEAQTRIAAFRHLTEHVAAVCTKYPALWQ